MRGFKDIRRGTRRKPILGQQEDSFVSKFLISAFNHSIKTEALLSDLRVSAAPFCGILNFLEYLSPEEGHLEYASQHYFGVGTFVHANWQNFMVNCSMGKHAFGCWECSNCGKEYKQLCFRPGPCEDCGSDIWHYKEVAFQFGALSGHMDMLIKDDKGKWVGMELKTTSVDNLNNPTYLPQAKHTIQVEIYCTLLKLVYDIEVDRYVIVYVSREKPTLYHYCPSVSFTAKKLKFWEDHITYSQRAYSAVRKLINPKHADRFEDHLETLMLNRPCWSKEDYYQTMDAAFYGSAQCPLKEAGLCARPDPFKLKKQLLKGIKDYHGKQN